MADATLRSKNALREVPCIDCSASFLAGGRQAKRCPSCFVENKRRRERENKRARHVRRVTCLRCEAPFEGEVHAHTKYCEPCARRVHHEQTLVHTRTRSKLRRKEDPAFRVYSNISTLIRRCLNGSKRHRSWEAVTGYTAEELMLHLERQFAKGMSWDNYGTTWHVDHIIPRALFVFDGADHPEFKACWALSNLRPLWARANRQKNAKRLHLL